MIEFREATYADAEYVLAHARGPQQRTIEKLGIDPVSLLRKAIDNEYPSFVALVNGVPAAVFGGASHTFLGETRLWMLTTNLVESHQVPLLRYSRRFIRWMFREYGPVIGACDCDFPESRAWLLWLGFKEISSDDFIVMRYSGGH